MKWPSIPQPSTDAQSMHTALLATKENIELMQGVRGNSPFVMASTLEGYDNQLANLRKQDVTLQGNIDKKADDSTIGYRKHSSQRVTAVNQVIIKDIPTNTKHMRLDVRLTPDTVNDTFDMRFSSDNGASWSATASSYGNILNYHKSDVAGGASGSDIVGTELQLCVGNVLQQQGIGYIFTGTVSGWFGTGKHLVVNGATSWHIPTYVLVGTYMGWRDQNTFTWNALRIYSRSGNLFSGHVATEVIS